ncbi:E3 ubiquitin-protein ligase EL5-like [Miscanthus floridulus]|uniref:E3 ubiquitin-protein ligase EL5-like n=1 Tax=Miscanthus floridulus TaxID=154761 RepID=UPI003459C29B
MAERRRSHGSPSGGAVAAGGAITVASAIVVFVAISIVLYCFDAWDGALPRRRGGHRGDGTAGSNGATRTRGVDPELLRSPPVTVYVYRAAVPGSKEDAAECSVCLAELEDGEEARFLPCCGHGFHAECVDMWLASHTTCPLCRLTVSKPDPDSSQTPTPASALRPLPPEPANLPRSVLLGVSDQGAVTAVNMTSDDGDDTTASASTAAAPVPVIEIPELAPVPTPTPRDAAKSSLEAVVWSFGRQGPSSSSSCTCGGAGEVADVGQGISVTVGMAVAEAQLPSEATRPVRPRDLLCSDGPPDVSFDGGEATHDCAGGGFALQKKLSALGSYPVYTPCDSNRGWHGEWFYIRNLVEVPFLPFTGRRLEKQENWSWGPASRQKKKVELQKLM